MNEILAIVLIMALGYLLGRITVKGFSLGNSAVMLVALVFGHFGVVAPAVIKNFGLVCFTASVGIIAGPTFFANFKKGAMQYLIIGTVTVLIGALTCVAIIKTAGVDPSLALGLMNGALTSTPGLAAALEVTGNSIASVGYGIAYPFGVLGVVFFVQLMPRLLNTNVKEEINELENIPSSANKRSEGKIIIEPTGVFVLAFTATLGILLGNIKIPLGSGSFSLGMSGGPLIVGLFIGHYGRIGRISHRPKNTQSMLVLRELGLALFLLGAGTEAGQGFVEILKEQGIALFVYGMIMTVVPMVLSFALAKYVLKMGTINSLGTICGGMTSTPALGSLISTTQSEAVAIAYAAAYPIALIMVVLSTQLIYLLV